jgi:ATP-dependent Lhr-like helicase
MISAEAVTTSDAVLKCVQGWLQILGPTTTSALAVMLGIAPGPILQALLAMEMQGLALRGIFENGLTENDFETDSAANSSADAGHLAQAN